MYSNCYIFAVVSALSIVFSVVLDHKLRICYGQALNEELKAKEQELDDLDGEVILEGRETWRIGGEMEDVRILWRSAKRDYKNRYYLHSQSEFM